MRPWSGAPASSNWVDPNPIAGSFGEIRDFSFKDWLRNLWYPFTVCASGVSVYVADNTAMLFPFFYLLLRGQDQQVSLQVFNIFLELIVIGGFRRCRSWI